jgi:hypothetical protein
MLLVGGDNVRITGLRFEGGDTVRDQDLGDNVLCAIKAIERTGLEIDNNEFSGWSYAGVVTENSANSTAYAFIHHNYMHQIKVVPAGMDQRQADGCIGFIIILFLLLLTDMKVCITYPHQPKVCMYITTGLVEALQLTAEQPGYI